MASSKASPPSASQLFCTLLAQCGCTFCPDGLVLPSSDIPSFLQKLHHRLQSDSAVVDNFLLGLQEFASNDSNLRRLLTPSGGIGREAGVIDTLARLLLSITTIQTQVANILLEKVPEYCADTSSNAFSSLRDNTPRLILSQFQWLDYLVDGENIVRKMMEILSICSMELQKEIITLIPEIVSDSSHELVVHTLQQILEGDTKLIAPILDALSNLNLDEEHLDKVVSLAISSLRYADAEDLPLVVKFLLQSANIGNVRRIVCQLRENLHFASCVSTKELKQEKLKGKAIVTNCEALVLAAIRSGLRFQNIMCEAILKEVKGLEQVHEHKTIDFWLLLIIYANGGPFKKLAESVLKRKASVGLFGNHLLNQCIKGKSILLQDYFQPLLCITHGLLSSKESAARDLGSHMYVSIFGEFADSYHRQEVLGFLITHTGSGLDDEVTSALGALIIISSRHSDELLRMSSYISSILDYVHSFNDNNLHQVYKVFGQLAIAAWSHGSSANGAFPIANELLIVLRKQITNPDPRYRCMGIIGAVELISCLGSECNVNHAMSAGNVEKSSFEETFTLLQMIMEACKMSSTARGFLYDELASLCETLPLNGVIMEWIVKQTIEFESVFLSDLDAGNISSDACETGDLKGEAWMNLDGDVSPILLNIHSLLKSDDVSSSEALIFLPSSFRLLAAVERATNQGSLGNIDALLGCPFYLPEFQVFKADQWKELPVNLKEISCLALYYAINWIRELINAYSTQLDGKDHSLTEATREEISTKLLKRMRNLIYLEQLLDECVELVPSVVLPVLHSETDAGKISVSKQDSVNMTKSRRKRKSDTGEQTQNSPLSQVGKDVSQSSKGGLKQSKIPESFRNKTKEPETMTPYHSQKATLGCSIGNHEKVQKSGKLEQQKWKCRPLRLNSLSILCISQEKQLMTCCADPCAELPLHLYMLNDLDKKLEWIYSQNQKQFLWPSLPPITRPPGLGSITTRQFLKRLEAVFPSLRKHLDSAVKMLSESGSCDDHWNSRACAAGNPEYPSLRSLTVNTASSVLAVVIRCLSRIFGNPEYVCQENFSTLRTLLSAFCTKDSRDTFLLELQPNPPEDSAEYAFCSVYGYFDSLFDAGASKSFSLASELVVLQKALLICAEFCIETSKTTTQKQCGFFCSTSFFPYLKNRLSMSAGRVLQHEWGDDEQSKCVRSRGDVLHQLIRVYLHYNNASLELLEKLASSIMPQVPEKGKRGSTVDGYSNLSPGTFLIWYRVQHEELQIIFNEVVKKITTLQRSKAVKENDVTISLVQAQQCARVMVALVNLTKIHCEKTALHSVALKFGGKFIDTFLKGIEFWQAQYQHHKDSINALVKELQKATRTIQTLCSEAKGLKKTPVTSKIPAVKRSMERYVFCIKALLHNASQGDTFWMGNLKHKNLRGEEIGSQLPVSDEESEDETALDGDHEQVVHGESGTEDNISDEI